MATCIPYPQTVSLIENGTNVDSDVTNVPIQQLRKRTDHLKCVLDNLVFEESSSKILDRAVTDAVVNFLVVYFEDSSLEFDRALAGTELSGSLFVATEETFAIGVAIDNNGLLSPNRKATIVTQGVVSLGIFTDILQSTETLTAADLGKPCYLSAIEPGKVTLIKPGVSVLVGYFLSFNEFYVDIDIRNLAENHTHVRIVLDRFTFAAAGPTLNPVDPTFPDGVWLYPAASLDPFPPLPPEGTGLFVNGVKQFYGQDYFIDTDGLYLTELVPSPIATPAPTPPDLDSENYEFYFSINSADTQAGVVSLQPLNENIIIENCIPGGPPSSGRLKIGSRTRYNIITTTAPGPDVLKDIDYNTSTDVVDLQFGKVVYQVAAGRNVGVSEDATIPGRWIISSSARDVILEPVADIALRNAKEQIDQERRSYIEFLGDDTPTGILGTVFFPGPLSVATNMEIIIYYFGLVAGSGTSPNEFGFSLSYAIDKPNNNWQTPFTPLVDKELDLGIGYAAFSGRRDTIFRIPIPLTTPESLIRFRLDRLDNSAFTNPYEESIGVSKVLYRLPLV